MLQGVRRRLAALGLAAAAQQVTIDREVST